MSSLTIDHGQFRQVLGHLPTGVVVVTAPGPVGMAIGSFFSVSLEPALVGFCVGFGSSTWPSIRDAGVFCASVLAHDQEAICRSFAASGTDKFAGVEWRPTATGSPWIEDSLVSIDCEIDGVHPAGDHEICIGRVRGLQVEREVEPLVFFRGGYRTLVP